MYHICKGDYLISKHFKSFRQFGIFRFRSKCCSYSIVSVETKFRISASYICSRAVSRVVGHLDRTALASLTPLHPGFQSWKTAPTGSFVLFPSRMPVILVLAHRIHVLRGAAVGQEFDGLQPCKAGRAPCYRIPRQMTLPTLPSSWANLMTPTGVRRTARLYRPGTLITRVKLSSMLNFTD